MGGKPRYKTVQCLDCACDVQQYQYGNPKLRKVRCYDCVTIYNKKWQQEHQRKQPRPPRRFPHAAHCVDCGGAFECRQPWHKRCAACAAHEIATQEKLRWVRARVVREAGSAPKGQCRACGAWFVFPSRRHRARCHACGVAHAKRLAQQHAKERFLLRSRTPGLHGNSLWRETKCVDCSCALVSNKKTSPRCRPCALARAVLLKAAAERRRNLPKFPRPAVCVDCSKGYTQIRAVIGGKPCLRCPPCAKERKRKQDLASAARRRGSRPVIGCLDCKVDFVQILKTHLRCRHCSLARQAQLRAKKGADKRIRMHEDVEWAARVRKYQREYSKHKRKTDPRYRFRCIISGGVRRGHGIKKPASWLKLMPYTLEQLMAHIERQFTGRMTWANHSRLWELDHIVPVSSFNITGFDCPDFYACWALSNLRPLLKKKNQQKGGRREHLL